MQQDFVLPRRVVRRLHFARPNGVDPQVRNFVGTLNLHLRMLLQDLWCDYGERFYHRWVHDNCRGSICVWSIRVGRSG